MNPSHQTNAPDLKLPITAVPGLYKEGFKEALQEFCTPLEDAKTGDIVAAHQHCTLSGDENSPLLMQFFVQAGDDHGASFEEVYYREASRDLRGKIGGGALLAQAIGINQDKLIQAAAPLDTRRIILLFAPDFLVAINAHYAAILGRSIKRGPVTQETIDLCFTAILPQAVESAHHAVELAPLATQITSLVNAYYPMHAAVAARPSLQLTSPDIGMLKVA
jgi:hypothetical protein